MKFKIERNIVVLVFHIPCIRPSLVSYSQTFNYYFKDLVYQYTQIFGCTIKFV